MGFWPKSQKTPPETPKKAIFVAKNAIFIFGQKPTFLAKIAKNPARKNRTFYTLRTRGPFLAIFGHFWPLLKIRFWPIFGHFCPKLLTKFFAIHTTFAPKLPEILPKYLDSLKFSLRFRALFIAKSIGEGLLK